MTSLIPTLVITCSIIVLALLLFFILSRSKSRPSAKEVNGDKDDTKQQGVEAERAPGHWPHNNKVRIIGGRAGEQAHPIFTKL